MVSSSGAMNKSAEEVQIKKRVQQIREARNQN